MAAPDTKAIIFDCFGVLYVDSKQSLLSVVPEDRRKELHDIFTANNYGYLDRNEYLEQVGGVTGMSAEQVAEYTAHEHTANIALLQVVRTRLHGAYSIGLLSNIGRGWIQDFFSRHQLESLFDKVVLSSEEGMTKPHEEIFLLMAERLGALPSECIMIDDIVENCEGARSAGMRSIHFVDTHQALTELGSLLGKNIVDTTSDPGL